MKLILSTLLTLTLNATAADDVGQTFIPQTPPSAKIRAGADEKLDGPACGKMGLQNLGMFGFYKLTNPINFNVIGGRLANGNENIDAIAVYRNTVKGRVGMGAYFYNTRTNQFYGCIYFQQKPEDKWELYYEKDTKYTPNIIPDSVSSIPKIESYIPDMFRTTLEAQITDVEFPEIKTIYTEVDPSNNYPSHKLSLKLGLIPECRKGGDNLRYVAKDTIPEEKELRDLLNGVNVKNNEAFANLVKEAQKFCGEVESHN